MGPTNFTPSLSSSALFAYWHFPMTWSLSTGSHGFPSLKSLVPSHLRSMVGTRENHKDHFNNEYGTPVLASHKNHTHVVLFTHSFSTT